MTPETPPIPSAPSTEASELNAGRCAVAPGSAYRCADGALTCALCDCEMEWEDCSACAGDGGFDGYEEDPNWYAPGEVAPCSQCGTRGGDWWCQTKDCKTITCTRIISSPNTEVRLFGVEFRAGKIMHNVQNKSCACLHNVHSGVHRRR